MKLKTALGWIIMLTILIGGGWFVASKTNLFRGSEGVTLERHEVHAEDPNKQFRIDIAYPELYGLPSAALDAKVNAEIKADLDALALSFRKDAESVLAEGAPETESYLSVDYAVLYHDEHLLSLRFDIGTYSSGAAHPDQNVTTLLYDLDHGEAVPLATVFKPSSDYLSFLANYTAKDSELAKVRFPGNAHGGLDPKEENFKNYLVTKEGLLILFDPYQIAPYAAGPQKLLIPWKELTSILSPDPRFSRFLNR